jgi:S1-C subfamily serine protease
MRSIIASDQADLAVLECSGVEGDLPFAPLTDVSPAPGDPVLVMGYPLGLRALMARSDEGFVRALREEGVDDFFEQARRLAAAGFMAPLASRGIVGQVTSASVVYDAETTSGGSGGPVLTLDGRVVAINTAILPEFGGSNLGVPAAAAQALLDRAQGN